MLSRGLEALKNHLNPAGGDQHGAVRRFAVNLHHSSLDKPSPRYGAVEARDAIELKLQNRSLSRAH